MGFLSNLQTVHCTLCYLCIHISKMKSESIQDGCLVLSSSIIEKLVHIMKWFNAKRMKERKSNRIPAMPDRSALFILSGGKNTAANANNAISAISL